MGDAILIRLYHDQFGALQELDDQSTVVTDLASFVAARRAIEALKAGELPAPLTIVVRSAHFAGGFHDLDVMGTLVAVTRISPRQTIAQALNIPVPSVFTNDDLISVGILGPADILSSVGQLEIRDETALEDALLARAFGSWAFASDGLSDFEGWFRELIGLACSGDCGVSAAWGVRPFRELARQRARASLERFGHTGIWPFVSDLVSRATSGDARPYLHQLVVRYWLASYPKLGRKAVVDNMPDQVGQWTEVPNEGEVLGALASWGDALYRQLDHALCERVEQVLGLLLESDELIEAPDPLRFIERTSGRFVSEYEAVQARVGNSLFSSMQVGASDERATLLGYLARINAHFSPFLDKLGQPAANLMWVEPLFELGDLVRHLDASSPRRWRDWVATYDLLIRTKALRKTLVGAVPLAFHEEWSDLDAQCLQLDERVNSRFGDWLMEIYPALLTGAVDEPRLVMNGARMALDRIASGERVILLVLDGLDWELWRSLRGDLRAAGFVVQGEEAGLAILPSITEFSRRAVFGGLSPRDLATFVDDIYGTEIRPREEARTLARALGYLGRMDQLKPLAENRHVQVLEGELVYANGSSADLRYALTLDARCYALVYTEIDAHIHVSRLDEMQLKDSARTWLADLVDDISQGIQSNHTLREESSLRLIVTSDHGFVDVSSQAQARLDSSVRGHLDLERHGRLAILRSNAEEALDEQKLMQAAKEFVSENSLEWHAIWRDQAAQYGLAESSPSEGRVIAWLMPRSLSYITRGKGHYVHGGLSLYEMIVPLVELMRGELGIEGPAVTLSGRLASEEQGTLLIAVLNRGGRSLEDLSLSIPELGVGRLHVGSIGPGEMRRLDMMVVAPRSGDLQVRVLMEGESGSTKVRFEDERVLAIEPGRRERMRRSTRRTFADDEEW